MTDWNRQPAGLLDALDTECADPERWSLWYRFFLWLGWVE